MQRAHVSKEKRSGHNPVTCWGISRILELLDMESLYSHRLALVPGLVDDRATATLAQDAVLTLCVLQLAVLQEEPTAHTVKGLASNLRQGVLDWVASFPSERITVVQSHL